MFLARLTGHYGIHHILKLKQGETLLVSGAAGAVGTVVGQIGKILVSPVVLLSHIGVLFDV